MENESEQAMETRDLLNHGEREDETDAVSFQSRRDSLMLPAGICGVRLKTAAKTSICLLAVGLAFVTLGIIVMVVSNKTQTGHTATLARHWKETPLEHFAILFLVVGGGLIAFALVTLVRVILRVKKFAVRRAEYGFDSGDRTRTVSTVSGYVESQNGHILESFPPLEEGAGRAFVAHFLRKPSHDFVYKAKG